MPEESPPISEESRSSDSISYYLNLRKDPPEQQQQQQQQQSTQPQRRTLKHTDSVQLAKARLHHEVQPPHTSQQQLQLRQVCQRGDDKRVVRAVLIFSENTCKHSVCLILVFTFFHKIIVRLNCFAG